MEESSPLQDGSDRFALINTSDWVDSVPEMATINGEFSNASPIWWFVLSKESAAEQKAITFSKEGIELNCPKYLVSLVSLAQLTWGWCTSNIKLLRGEMAVIQGFDCSFDLRK